MTARNSSKKVLDSTRTTHVKKTAPVAAKTSTPFPDVHSSAATTFEQSGNLTAVLAAATEQADSGEFGVAAGLFAHAASLAPRNVEILGSLGEVLMEAGRPDEACEALRKAIELSPAAGFEKFMYLSQLLGNTMEAVEVSRSGLEVLRREKHASGCDPARHEELAGYEVSALCGIAELLLGIIEDSNDQTVADKLDGDVERAISEALGVCIPESQSEVEASMALANLRLSQARREDARAAMERVATAMRPGLDVLEDENGGDAAIVKGIGMLPPLPIRLAAGKQLVEVELWNEGIDVLSSTLYECDFNVEVWYLLALAFHETSASDPALAALDQARAALQNPEGHVGLVADSMLDDLETRIHSGKDKSGGGREGHPDEGNTKGGDSHDSQDKDMKD